MDKKIMIVAGVAILIVVAVAVAFVLSSDDSDDSVATTEGQLEVYGNANEDEFVNQKDIDLIQRIIDDGIVWQKEYPFADANYDGIVDSKDIQKVKDIMNATSKNMVEVWHNNECKDEKYVVSTMYPITSILFDTSVTTVVTAKTLGIHDEIKGTSYSNSAPTSSDRYVFEEYLPMMKEQYRVGTGMGNINVDTASDFVTKYGCTAYICSSSSSTPENADELEKIGIDIVQMPDGVSNPDSYKAGILTLAFLFSSEKKDYYDRALEFIEWMNVYYKDLSNRLVPVYNGKVAMKAGAASSMTTYVSVKGSSNTDIIEQAGLSCPVDMAIDGKSTKPYKGGTDTWLNAVPLDGLVCLKGSTSDWSWFDGKYDNMPDAYAKHMGNFSSLDCFKKGQVIMVSIMMPGPLKSGAVAQFYYPDLFYDGWIEQYLKDFYQTFWGWSADMVKDLRFCLTQEDIF